MSLLDSGPAYEDCVVFLEETVDDRWGNPQPKASETGIAAVARFQPQNQSGIASRAAETDSEGFGGEQYYSVRFQRSFPHVLGPQSYVVWRGEKWFVFGEPSRHNGSSVTRRLTYKVKRS